MQVYLDEGFGKDYGRAAPQVKRRVDWIVARLGEGIIVPSLHLRLAHGADGYSLMNVNQGRWRMLVDVSPDGDTITLVRLFDHKRMDKVIKSVCGV